MKTQENTKGYNPHEVEKEMQEFWERRQVYKFDTKSKAELFSIDTPPPTVSGKMHLGHAFSYSHQDFIARFKRMQGFNVFYPWGFDDNGLATELFIENKYKVHAEKMQRHEFVKLCLEGTKEAEQIMREEWQRMGISVDWHIFYRTISPEVVKLSQKSFVDLYRMGRAYRKKDTTTWCVKCRTAIAQAELEDVEKETQFVYIKFDVENANEKITIATTRPEMMPACVAVFVNPADKRYKNLVGKKVVLPFLNRAVPILESEIASQEKGTGAVYFCTFGHYEDVEFFRTQNLPVVEILNPDGTLNENAGIFRGMHISELRGRIIEELKKLGRVEKIEPLRHVVNVHERCGTPVEFIVTKQWFIKYLDLKKKFLEEAKKIKWHPPFMFHRLEHWINGLKWDWCISRQRYYGIPFPVWYCKKCNEIFIADEKDLPIDPLKDSPKKACICGSKEFLPERDVIDTWATSSLTPQIAIKLSSPKLYKKLFPMDLRPQAHDIINFWLFYTLAKSIMHENKIPWKNVMISGYALDSKGKKMSKSKGNIVEPSAIIEKYSADCLRFWAAGASLGNDLPFQEKDLLAGRNFITKMWNASKFALMHLEGFNEKNAKLRTIDKWLLSKLNALIKFCTESFEEYEYQKVKSAVEQFYWHSFCDNYIEIVKDRLYNPSNYGEGEKFGAQYALYVATETCLKLLAPILPHVTEKIFQMLPGKKETESIHLSRFPEFSKKQEDKKAEEAGNLLVEIVSAVRRFKHSKNLSLGKEISRIYIWSENSGQRKIIEEFIPELKGALRAGNVSIERNVGIEPVEIHLPIEVRIEL